MLPIVPGEVLRDFALENRHRLGRKWCEHQQHDFQRACAAGDCHQSWKPIALAAQGMAHDIDVPVAVRKQDRIGQPWFYTGLGVAMPEQAIPGTAMALILFSLTLPAFTFPLTPLMSWLSRQHEYQADAYAVQQTRAADLVNALVKLYRDNAATLTPDPLHSLFCRG